MVSTLSEWDKLKLIDEQKVVVKNLGAGWVWYVNKPRGPSSHTPFKNEEEAWTAAGKFFGMWTNEYAMEFGTPKPSTVKVPIGPPIGITAGAPAGGLNPSSKNPGQPAQKPQNSPGHPTSRLFLTFQNSGKKQAAHFMRKGDLFAPAPAIGLPFSNHFYEVMEDIQAGDMFQYWLLENSPNNFKSEIWNV